MKSPFAATMLDSLPPGRAVGVAAMFPGGGKDALDLMGRCVAVAGWQWLAVAVWQDAETGYLLVFKWAWLEQYWGSYGVAKWQWQWWLWGVAAMFPGGGKDALDLMGRCVAVAVAGWQCGSGWVAVEMGYSLVFKWVWLEQYWGSYDGSESGSGWRWLGWQ
jgi:hypothetical protein